jgi:hypothetical protein
LSPSLHGSTPARRIFDRSIAACVRGRLDSFTPGLLFSSTTVPHVDVPDLAGRSVNPDLALG